MIKKGFSEQNFRKHPLFLIILLVVLIVCYLFIDRPITQWAASLPNTVTKWAKSASWAIDPLVFTIGLPLIFYVYTFILNKAAYRKKLLFVILAVPLAIISIDILKIIVGRARPTLWLSQGIYGIKGWGWGGKWHSFPSGHAATIGGFMAALAQFRPRATLPLLLAALALSFLRVLSLDHYFSDTVAAIAIAYCIVSAFYGQYKTKF